jgi:hypothetical protein
MKKKLYLFSFFDKFFSFFEKNSRLIKITRVLWQIAIVYSLKL